MRFVLVFLGLLLNACVSIGPPAPLYVLSFVHPDGGGTDRVELYAATGEFCQSLGVADGKRVTYVYRERVRGKPEVSGTTVEGCYKIVPHDGAEFVAMAFADGDSAAIPLQAFKDGRMPQARRPGARDA